MNFWIKIALIIATLIAVIGLLSWVLGALIWVVIIGVILGLVGLVIKLWLDSKTNKQKVAVPSLKRADKEAKRALKKIEREINRH
jgi:hypothetical protein